MFKMTRRGILGILAALCATPSHPEEFAPPGSPHDPPPTPASFRLHEHTWCRSPYWLLASDRGDAASLIPKDFIPLEVCSVKHCGMLRVYGGEINAGRVYL